MYTGYVNRVTCRDGDCAMANNCSIGGVQCQCCGMWFCPDCEEFDDRGYCSECAEEHPSNEQEEDEDEDEE